MKRTLTVRGSQPVGRDPFGVVYHLFFQSDIYITIHNSRKITVISNNKNNFMVGRELY